MRKLTFEPIVDENKRKAIVKDTVNGYRHTEVHGIHLFQRGKIAYIINAYTEIVTLEKYDYLNEHYLSVEYEDFSKFVDIKKIGVA